MFSARDLDELAYADEFLETADYGDRRFGERLDDAIRRDDARQALRDNNSPDFWKPVDDWMLD